MHLYDAACPPSGAVGSVKLEHAPGAAIGANSGLHRPVLLHRGLGELLSQRQYLPHLRRRSFQQLGDGLFAERIRFHAACCKPQLHLLHRIGVIQGGKLLHGRRQLGAGTGVHLNGLPHQLHVQHDAPVVDLLVDAVFVPHTVQHGILRQSHLDGRLGLHVADVVLFERQPPVRGVRRKIAGTLTVGLCGRAGLAEIPDQFLALGQLLLFQPQHRACAFQRKRQAHRCGPDHGAAPRLRIEVLPGGIAEKPGEADAFESGVIRPFGDGVVFQRGDDLRREPLSVREIDLLNGSAVCAVGKKQNFKIRGFRVPVDARFRKVNAAVRFQVAAHIPYFHLCNHFLSIPERAADRSAARGVKKIRRENRPRHRHQQSRPPRWPCLPAALRRGSAAGCSARRRCPCCR